MRIQSSETIMGLWNLSSTALRPKLSAAEGRALIKHAYRMGIHTFDTAFSYGDADSILSAAMREMGNPDARIISKVMPVPTLRKKAMVSLRRLRRESIDVLLLHWPSDDRSLFTALRELEKLREEGLASEIGVSNFPLPLLRRISRDFPILYHERPLSLLWPKDADEEAALGLRMLCYSPLGMGLLAGKGQNDARQGLPMLSSPAASRLMEITGSDPSIALSWVYMKNPYGVISGFGKESDMEILQRVRHLDRETMQLLDGLAASVSASLSIDNIFAHSWH